MPTPLLTCYPHMVLVQEKHIREELHKYLPRDDPKAAERPAEEAFRKRM